MRFVKTVCMYVVAGAATAIGWKTIETLSNPYDRAVLEQKFKTIKHKIKKGR